MIKNKEKDVLRIAVPNFVSSTFFPLIAAKELGIFKEEGQDIEIVLFNAAVARDAEFYQPSIPMDAIGEMNRFAKAVGLFSSPVSYEQVVATQFRSLWYE